MVSAYVLPSDLAAMKFRALRREICVNLTPCEPFLPRLRFDLSRQGATMTETATTETAEGSASIETPPGVEDPPSTETTSTAEVVVEVKDLSKHYGTTRAVDGISFTVRRGDILGFLGPNGAGKTTAMRLITGFLEPDGGSVRVAGHDMATDSLAARQRIGYLPENAPAYGEMTASGFLEFIAEARGVQDISAAITKVVAMTGLEKVMHQPIETLSKGFKRRVGLAQALIHDPEVLILDEPTDGLDPNQKAMVQDLIANLSRNKCIILSTHILDEVERVCNRAMIISEGKILVDSTPEELITQAPSHNVIRLTFEEPQAALVERIAELPWCDRVETPSDTEITVVPENGENHLAALLEEVKGVPLRGIHLDEGRLDELFQTITQGVSQ
jgi:ABC-2 type transport system ATP-binding protein